MSMISFAFSSTPSLENHHIYKVESACQLFGEMVLHQNYQWTTQKTQHGSPSKGQEMLRIALYHDKIRKVPGANKQHLWFLRTSGSSAAQLAVQFPESQNLSLCKHFFKTFLKSFKSTSPLRTWIPPALIYLPRKQSLSAAPWALDLHELNLWTLLPSRWGCRFTTVLAAGTELNHLNQFTGHP